ncbi:MAG: T9SS type A sorting domain-containing protein [Bacteroidales bacterium]|nr:T9SS type A sorting domain-containing protein [Bacteroidales bacterium]
MKIRTFLILVLIINASCFTTQSQNFWEWTGHVPLTDSLADNCNPFLQRTHYNNQQALFLFWDRSTDSVSTEIWMDNILDSEPPQIVLSDSGIHYTRPRIMHDNYYTDTLFYLFYETDQNGDKDIYYKVFLPDGSFTEGEVFAAMPGDDEQLSTGRNEFTDASQSLVNTIAWINNGRLYSRFFVSDNGYGFSETMLIDSNSCRAPVAAAGYFEHKIMYEKTDSSGTYIMQTHHSNNQWEPPSVFYDSTDSKNPTWMSYYGNECWSLKMDTVWKVIVTNWGNQHVYDLSKSTPFNPAIMGIVLGVEEWYMAWVAVQYPEDSVDEIYMAGWGDEFLNFTNTGTPNKNPAFFQGEGYNSWCWYDYLVWESFRNGHWQVWSSKVLQCVGGIKTESNHQNDLLQVHPNPFSQRTTITFSLSHKSDVLIDIYSLQGKHLRTLEKKTLDPGEHQFTLNGNDLPPSTYLIRMKAGKNVYCSKILKSN